ncbi:MAG TPA: D-aminoacyl-tRNA deacylase [Candidatus Omnitrophota bacterium]|nr:D-aminoacyl-tRNA deacylase [Candidatus Omnitrophota bacterium]HPD83866.1 D-aminoacyl-tRNA deacylase [Candidatus Omnitrophota bacterium]HRZ02723.1 D-aminoacyl-tRNA deacylase [Candidatus Omnitrophota bacterium]
MKLVIQRVKEASVSVNGEIIGKIAKGMVVLIGVGKDDLAKDADYLADKIGQLRIFEDALGKMNLCASEVGAEFLVVSQFTLLGACLKGRRPSFDAAADPAKAEELYEYFVQKLRAQNFKVETGRFKAMMDVSLVNDGPVTFILDSKND